MKFVCLVFSAAVVVSAAGCYDSPFVETYFDSRVIWTGDELFINSLRNEGVYYVDGEEYRIKIIPTFESASLVAILSLEKYNISREERKNVPDVEYFLCDVKLNKDVLELTVRSDYIFERGESEVDRTGHKFVLYNAFKRTAEKET